MYGEHKAGGACVPRTNRRGGGVRLLRPLIRMAPTHTRPDGAQTSLTPPVNDSSPCSSRAKCTPPQCTAPLSIAGLSSRVVMCTDHRRGRPFHTRGHCNGQNRRRPATGPQGTYVRPSGVPVCRTALPGARACLGFRSDMVHIVCPAPLGNSSFGRGEWEGCTSLFAGEQWSPEDAAFWWRWQPAGERGLSNLPPDTRSTPKEAGGGPPGSPRRPEHTGGPDPDPVHAVPEVRGRADTSQPRATHRLAKQ